MMRTTIKIYQDTARRVKALSFKEEEPLYQVYNDLLILGLKVREDHQERARLFRAIDKVKKAFAKAPFTAEEIYELSKKDRR